MKQKLIILLYMISFSSWSSTFIGNGGQVGDLELTVTKRQIRSTLNRLQELKSENNNLEVCKCPEDYSDHQLCEIIKELNSDQKQFCEAFIKAQLPKLEKAISAVKFEWINENLNVVEGNGQIRAADAIAQKTENKILINQSRFMDNRPYKRTFLLTHEIFHLDNYQGIELNDDAPIGPFKDKYGTRKLLNASAAGLVLLSIDENVFQQYTDYLKNSSSAKKHWLSLTGASTRLESNRNDNYNVQSSTGYRLSYRYDFDNLYNLGLTLQFEEQSGNKSIFTMTKIHERRNTSALGFTFKIFPFSQLDPFNSFWNSYFLTELLIESMHSEYKLEDDYTSVTSSAGSSSPAIRIGYFFPLKYNFWVSGFITYSKHQLIYQEINQTFNNNKMGFTLGATYGF